jgi:hypothetical protein
MSEIVMVSLEVHGQRQKYGKEVQNMTSLEWQILSTMKIQIRIIEILWALSEC